MCQFRPSPQTMRPESWQTKEEKKRKKIQHRGAHARHLFLQRQTSHPDGHAQYSVHRSRGGGPFAQRDPGRIVSHAEERSKIKCDFPTPDRQPLRFTGGTHPRANMHIEFELDFVALRWSRGARRMSLGRRVKPPQDLSVVKVFNISGGCL